MTDIQTKKVAFVDVVDEEGNPLVGFEYPVPEHWIGTSLLPPGAKKGTPAKPERATAASEAKVEAAVEAATKELVAKVVDLEAQVADLTKQLETAKATPPPVKK
jgi:enolase